MISVIIPTLNAEETLGHTLSSLVPAAVDGLVREVIVADGGSTDGTLQIADGAGTDVITTEPGRGLQLIAGAEKARCPWLLFLHGDTMLERGWQDEVVGLIERVEQAHRGPMAATFRFTLDDIGFAPRLLETAVVLREFVFALPYGDQGLLISRRLYDEIGGYKPLIIMEDVDIVRRIGRRRLIRMWSRAVTSAARFQKEGYARRVLRNQLCLARYMLGIRPEAIARIYASEPPR